MSVTLRNVAVTSRRNVANQRSNVIIIARKEGGAWERIILNAPQAVDRGEGQGSYNLGSILMMYVRTCPSRLGMSR